MKIKEGEKLPSSDFFYLDITGPKKLKVLNYLANREQF